MISTLDDGGKNLYDILISCVDHILNMTNNGDELLLLGDFNLPNSKWVANEDDDNYLPEGNPNYRESCFLNSLFSLGLNQMSGVTNVLGRQLDLVFFTDVDNLIVEPSPLVMSSVDDHHPPLLLNYCFNSENKPCPEVVTHSFNFKKANFSELSSKLASIDYNNLLSANELDVDVERFYSVLYEALVSCVPFEAQKLPSSCPPWYNHELKHMKNQKNRLWKAYLKRKDSLSLNSFINCYNQFRLLSLALYREYLSSMRDRVYTDSRNFFKFVNTKKKVDNYPNTMQHVNWSSSESSAICNVFASFFQQSFTSSDFQPNDSNFRHIVPNQLAHNISISITIDDIAKHIDELPYDFTSGPDGIPPAVLKCCAEVLLPPLKTIFQKSLNYGHFPTLWKNSYIIPIHKSGNKNEISNYRPIAKLSAIPKLFESIIYSAIMPICKRLISANQHGFLAARSTTTNLLEFTSLAVEGFVSGFQTDCVYTDFSKAFDKLSHSIIILKLRKLGFPPALLVWFQSYLAGRTYQVLFRGSQSVPIEASSGVPQGSHLGPLLFILSIDDIVPLLKHCRILIYADDIKLFRHIKSIEDCKLLQVDLDTFYSWCTNNNLVLNISKCEVMTFCRRRGPIIHDYTFFNEGVNRVNHVKDLGIRFDSKLDFSTHISFITSKGSLVLGFIKRWSKEFNNTLITKHLYISLVRPLLEYASQVWSPNYSSHIGRIESVQRRFVRFALRPLPWDDPVILPSYECRLKLLNLSTLYKRREVADVVFVHQLLNGRVDSGFLSRRASFRESRYRLRRPPLLHTNYSNTNYGRFEPVNRMFINVNKNINVFSMDISKDVLKRTLFNCS